jgi:CheY-like chemotaxis protein
VRVAGDGAEAVEIFRSWRPHFIWMDLRMPGMDGSEAARRIRTLEGGRDVTIAAATASEYTHSAEGMDDLVRKPYHAKEIFDCMARHLGVAYRSEDEVAAASPALPEKLRPEALAALPVELRTELTDAVVALDIERIHAGIRRVSEIDPGLGAALSFQANRFAFTRVLEVLTECDKVAS